MHYPAILFPPDGDGIHGCAVPDLLINASGRSADEALLDAAEIMHELLAGMARKGEPFPEPTSADDLELDGGTLALILAQPQPAVA